MVTRREFIKSFTFAILGGLAASSVAPTASAAGATGKGEAPPLPWPYVKLDPEETRKLGHLGYYAFECAGGAFWAIAVQLREKIGYPWTLLPIPSREEVLRAVNEGGHGHLACPMQYGYGGAVGWSTLCGSLNGSLFIINMVAENRDWDKIGKALMRWYETFPFPSDKMNEYVTRGEVYVKRERLKSSKWLPRSVSGSVLCHVSVSKWCVVSGYASGSKERAERCARLTGDVAAKTVELLNAYFEGRLEEVTKIKLSPTTVGCRVCHYKGKEYEIGQFTRGYMQCETCHHDLRPHAHTIVAFGQQPSSELQATPAKREFESLTRAAIGSTIAIGALTGVLAVARKRSK
ncbi:split soret cytochrome c precursor [Pyrolobus fumarii 1A]|uniref:Split soret cytochrome c n=1 Tax=Pyrolobus fumarii (strain DSM 11204 / 1A) TaxID=694429 RepID=G0EFW5_PYRF1|nr:C-GCAxxG-C-C family protein [Pyrolobus fumarii]AEM39066.1 split soret cytochrome c precursor [Pyrolobus fumarii 1A]